MDFRFCNLAPFEIYINLFPNPYPLIPYNLKAFFQRSEEQTPAAAYTRAMGQQVFPEGIRGKLISPFPCIPDRSSAASR